MIKKFRELHRANDHNLEVQCRDAHSAGCKAIVADALGGRDDQINLGIDESVLGAGSQGRSNLVLSGVMGKWNRAEAQSFCQSHPERCVTTPQGVIRIGTGVVKGVANSPLDMLNLGPTAINGLGYIDQTIAGKPLTNIVDPLPYPSATQPNGELEQIGAIGGGLLGTSALVRGAGLILEWSPGAAAGRTAKNVDEMAHGSRQPSNNGANGGTKIADVGLEIPPGKFDYLFGRSVSNEHNAARSNQLALEMKRLGVPDTLSGRQMLSEHLTQSVKAEGNVVNTFSNQYGTFEVRESFFMGPSGKAVNLQSTFQILPEGTRRLSTVIPRH